MFEELIEYTFSTELQKKIDSLKSHSSPITLGKLSFDSKLLMAPMAGITSAPFRRLIQELGAGGAISELISSHGINHKNKNTRDMLFMCHQEKNTGLQIFGESGKELATAAEFAQKMNPKFIDINMGCPVRKVVKKGAGSALLKDLKKLPSLIREVRNVLTIPMSIKIRLGWDQETKNADEVVKIASGEGVDFVTIHGRTQNQMYKGEVDWDYIENIANNSTIPIIGNGDLNSPELTNDRMKKTCCQGLMLGRGPLHNPFIFLESIILDVNIEFRFTFKDRIEVLKKLLSYMHEQNWNEKIILISMKKHACWFSSGFSGAGAIRNRVMSSHDIDELMTICSLKVSRT